jgi:crotonobetainyl-CoA:carnitine CoA-transferase CaiB-like acyl-CoA transferase
MIGGNALAYADDFLRYEGKPQLATADEENHGLHALYRLYRAETGWIFLAAPRQREWEALTAALDRPDLADDDRFASEAARLADDDALVALLAELFATQDARAWEELLTAAGVACVEAFDASHSEFTCTDPVLRETGLVVEVDHPAFDKILRAGPPVALSETPGRVAAGTLVGQHTDQILGELGYSAEQVQELKTKQVVFAPPDEST